MINLKVLDYGFSVFVLMCLWCVSVVSRDVILFVFFCLLKNLVWDLPAHEIRFCEQLRTPARFTIAFLISWL